MSRETSPVSICLLFEQLIIMGRKIGVFVRCRCYKLTTINYANTDIQKKHVLACDFISIYWGKKKTLLYGWLMTVTFWPTKGDNNYFFFKKVCWFIQWLRLKNLWACPLKGIKWYRNNAFDIDLNFNSRIFGSLFLFFNLKFPWLVIYVFDLNLLIN